MSPEVVYTMAQAAKASGVSEASIRNYTSGRYAGFYADFLTPGARPGTGQPRRLAHDDVILLAYVHRRTRQGATHETIRAEIAGGALADFEPPTVNARQASESRQTEEGAPNQPAALAVLQDMARQLAVVMAGQVQAAQARADSLADQLREAEVRAASAEREAQLLRAEVAHLRGRGLLARLFGR